MVKFILFNFSIPVLFTVRTVLNQSPIMPKKQSIAESIEQLIKPKALAQSDSEDEGQLKLSESLANVNVRQRSSGILKKSVPLLHELDKKYKGVVASRRELVQESSDEDGSSDEDPENSDPEGSEGEEQEDAESSDDKAEAESEDDDNDMGISDFISQFKSKVQKDVQEDSDEEEVGDEEGSESNPEDSELDDSSEDDDDEVDTVDESEEDDEAAASEEMGSDPESAVNSKSTMNILQPVQDNNVQKGHAVRTQLGLWERILETRIKLQPVLNKANGFPSADLFCQLQSSSDEFAEVAKKTQKSVATLLDNLIDLQNTMFSQFSETKSVLKSGLYKRKFTEDTQKNSVPHKKLCLDFQSEGGKAEEVFKTYRNSVIQKWSDRTKVTNARSSKELLLHQNVISQIEGVLLNKPDLIKSSQTVKGTYELFGQKNVEDEEQALEKTFKVSAEVYDDTDFYHQMLRELIEYKSNSSTNPAEAARNYSELQKLRTKIKKQVDQKASKGRKIR